MPAAFAVAADIDDGGSPPTSPPGWCAGPGRPGPRARPPPAGRPTVADLPGHERRRRRRRAAAWRAASCGWTGRPSATCPCSTTTPRCCARPPRRWAPSTWATRCGHRCCTSRWSPCTRWAAAPWPTTGAGGGRRPGPGVHRRGHRRPRRAAGGRRRHRPAAAGRQPAAHHLGPGRAGRALLAAERGWTVATGPTPPAGPAPGGDRPACASPSGWPAGSAITDEGDTVEATTSRGRAGPGRGHAVRVRPDRRDRRPAGAARRPVDARPPQRHRHRPVGVAPAAAGGRRLVPPGPGGPDPRRHLEHALRDAPGGRRRPAVRLRGPQGPERPGVCARRLERHHHAVLDPARRGRPRGGRRRAAHQPGDFARQLTTMRITGVEGRWTGPRWAGPLRATPPARCSPCTAARSATWPPSPRAPPAGAARPVPGTGGCASPPPSPAGATAPAAGTRATTTATTPGCAWSATRAGGGGRCCWPPGSACRPPRSWSTPSRPTWPSTWWSGLRRLAVRLPGLDRPALGPHGVHPRRHRPGRLAGRRGRGPAGHRRRRRAGAGPLRGVGVPAHGPGRRPDRRPLGGGDAVPLHPATSYLNQVKSALKVDRALKWLGQHKVSPLHPGGRAQHRARPGAAGGADAAPSAATRRCAGGSTPSTAAPTPTPSSTTPPTTSSTTCSGSATWRRSPT